MSLPFSCVSYNLHDAKSYPIIYSLVEIHHSGKNAVKSLWGAPWDLPAVELHKSRWEKSLKHWYQTEKTEINLKKSEGNIRLVIKYIIRSFLIHPQPYVGVRPELMGSFSNAAYSNALDKMNLNLSFHLRLLRSVKEPALAGYIKQPWFRFSQKDEI